MNLFDSVKQAEEAYERLEKRYLKLVEGNRYWSAVHLRQNHSPEAIKRAMGTRTSKAFNRYLQVTGDELRGLYADTRADIKEKLWDGKKI